MTLSVKLLSIPCLSGRINQYLHIVLGAMHFLESMTDDLLDIKIFGSMMSAFSRSADPHGAEQILTRMQEVHQQTWKNTIVFSTI